MRINYYGMLIGFLGIVLALPLTILFNAWYLLLLGPLGILGFSVHYSDERSLEDDPPNRHLLSDYNLKPKTKTIPPEFLETYISRTGKRPQEV